MSEESERPRHYEPDEVPGAKLIGIVASALLVAALLSVGAWGMLRAKQQQIRGTQYFPLSHYRSPATIVEVHQTIFPLSSDGPALEASQRHTLEQWRWADKDKQLVHLPIEEAMHMVASQRTSGQP